MNYKYITKNMAHSALKRMYAFNEKLNNLYESEGLELTSDIGRRNILLSSIQEREFSKELSNVFKSVTNDGRSGQPDIVIEDIEKELECKITSPHSGKTWSLQCDYATLEKKGSLDFLYVLVDRDFEKAAVLHFSDLTVEDFHKPASGSRGKARMNKHLAMNKCNTIFGKSIDKNAQIIEKAKIKRNNKDTKPYQKRKALEQIINWGRKNKQYSFQLENINGK